MCGGQSCLKSSLMHNEKTHKYTQAQNHEYKCAKYSRKGNLNSLHEERLFYFSCYKKQQQALTCPSFKLCFYAYVPFLKPSWSWYLWAGPDMHIIIIIIVIMHFRGGKQH